MASLLHPSSLSNVEAMLRIVQQAVGQLPWGHNVLLLTRLKERPLRLRYADLARRDGWSRTTLELQIRNRLHERQG